MMESMGARATLFAELSTQLSHQPAAGVRVVCAGARGSLRGSRDWRSTMYVASAIATAIVLTLPLMPPVKGWRISIQAQVAFSFSS